MAVVNSHISGGKIKIYTAYDELLVEIDLLNPAGVVMDERLSLLGVPLSGIAVADGEAVIARITENDSIESVAIEKLTVGKSEAHFVLDNTNIAIGQTVIITGGTLIHG
jgi:hypothetical protein